MDTRLERIAENERLLHEANDEVELLALEDDRGKAHRESTEVEFFCACGRPDCDETLLLTVAQYEAAHVEPHRFVVVPGHETPAIERVVERYETHNVVEKRPGFRADE